MPEAQASNLTTAFASPDTTGASDWDTSAPGAGPATGSGPLRAGEAFGTRYHIIKLLGMGGMGAVYQAWDQELGVAVALKVIRPEATADPAAAADMERRFKRELLLARQVTHTNVVRIHDLGEMRGIKYITMPFVQGSDLATCLKRDGPMPVRRVLKIARQIAGGLAAAHAAGVVHRDLKPANVMIGDDEHALIMDFGIARSANLGAAPGSLSQPVAPPQTAGAAATVLPSAGEETRGPVSVAGDLTVPSVDHATVAIAGAVAEAVAGTASSAMLTPNVLAASIAQGGVVGTLSYMAPEQARGIPADHRADIYAFGMIVSEMLIGRMAELDGLPPVEALMKRIRTKPVSLRAKNPAIPQAVDDLVLRCLEPDLEKRFQATSELVDVLDGLDEDGVPLPAIRRLTTKMVVASAALVAILLGATYFVTRKVVEPAKQHDPISVVIADFDNKTNDPTLNQVIEPTMKRALEGASFITAFDRQATLRLLGVRPDKFDAAAAQELAVKQGLAVVLAGVIEPQGSGYALTMKATGALTNNVLTEVKGRASSRDQILATATKLVASVRKALGDEATESAQIFAMTNLSSTSPEVVRLYTAAQEAASRNKFEDARDNALKAVQLDPNFGIGYQVLAVASRNMHNQEDADKYSAEALRHLDGMTERERYTTRGFFFRSSGDYQGCVKEYGELITRFSADVVGRNQHALCSTQLRNIKAAVDEMQGVVQLLPNRPTFRVNLALYANYYGDFATGEKEARTIQEPDAYASLALGFSQIGQGQIRDAIATFEKLPSIGGPGATFAPSALGDAAAVEGRYTNAIKILNDGAAADLEAKRRGSAAAKFAAAAYAQQSRGQRAAALAAAEKALANSEEGRIKFLAARIFVEAGEVAKAEALAATLSNNLRPEMQAYGKIVAANIASKKKDGVAAVKLLTEANGLLDTWIGHFDLGRAYLDMSAFPQADAEFDRCIKRRGEALALFLDEEPTYAFLPPVYYYQGRVREGLHSPGFAESYLAYLSLRGDSKEDPLVPDARKRSAR